MNQPTACCGAVSLLSLLSKEKSLISVSYSVGTLFTLSRFTFHLTIVICKDTNACVFFLHFSFLFNGLALCKAITAFWYLFWFLLKRDVVIGPTCVSLEILGTVVFHHFSLSLSSIIIW